MANDSYSQQALGADQRFLLRVRAALSTVAWEVLEEPADTENHAYRETYARAVIADLQSYAVQIGPWLVERPGVFLFETSYNFQAGAVVTAAGDADIQGQLRGDWDELAGTTPPPPEARI